jgi:hypothetical protein
MLRVLSTFFGITGPCRMIGTIRSRVSFFMNKFRKLGLIDYNGDIYVHNALLSVVLHDNPAIREKEDEV